MNIIYIIILLSILLIFFFYKMQKSNIKSNKHWEIGIYGLQEFPPLSGHQTGNLNNIKSDIDMINGYINTTIPMRSWNRDKYPNWDFFNYYLNYIQDIYNFTKTNTAECGIQTLTPALYPIFSDPPIDNIENDSNNNRILNKNLLKNFIISSLNKEVELILKSCNNDEKLLFNILSDSKSRIIKGWYLDDEPLIRNHDISVINDMGKYIRELEIQYYSNHNILSKFNINELFKNRYVAFDCDDLHDYPASGRKLDAQFYNLNGRNIKFPSNIKYTIFDDNCIDVLLLDFYGTNVLFWKKILKDIINEYKLQNKKLPQMECIIYSDIWPENNLSYQEKYYIDTIELLKQYDINGIWFYLWYRNIDEVRTLKSMWNNPKYNIKKLIMENL